MSKNKVEEVAVPFEEGKQAEPVNERAGKVYKLRFPVKHPDGSFIKELIIRPLKGGELRNLNVLPTDSQMSISLKQIGLMSAMPDVVFDEMDAVDIWGVLQEAAPFYVPMTGVTPGS